MMLKAPVKNDPNRRKLKKNTPVRIESATAAGSVITITFDQPVILRSGTVPQYTTDIAGASPVSAVMNNPMTMALTFSASVAAATEMTIPFEDPAVRNNSGGFVADSTFPV
jgi:hypothetical protein